MKRITKNWKIILAAISIPVILSGGLGLWMTTIIKSAERILSSISSTSDMDYSPTYAFRNDEHTTFTFYIDTPSHIHFSSWARNLWGYNEVIIQDDAENQVTRWKIGKNENHSEFLEKGDYTLVTKFGSPPLECC